MGAQDTSSDDAAVVKEDYIPPPLTEGRGPYLVASNQEIEYLKYYIKYKKLPKYDDRILIEKRFKQKAACFRVVNDTLYFIKQTGKLVEVISQESIDRINQIIEEHHGEEHKSLSVILKEVEEKYYGISRTNVSTWVNTCAVCKNFLRTLVVRRYQNNIKIVRDPWFAVAFYEIKANQVLPSKGGSILFLQDVYSRFTICEFYPVMNEEKAKHFLEKTINMLGIPEIVKVYDESLLYPEVKELIEKKEIQVVDISKYPDHFSLETTYFPTTMLRLLNRSFPRGPEKTFAEHLAEIIHDMNFKPATISSTGHSCKRYADMFYRRPIRISTKKKFNRHWASYKIQRADLPSIIDLLPEYPQSSLPKQDEEGLEGLEAEGKDSSKRTEACTAEEPPKTDKEVEGVMRAHKEEFKDALLYDPDNPPYPECEEFTLDALISLRGKSSPDMCGSIVYLAEASSFAEENEKVDYGSMATKMDIENIKNRTKGIINHVSADDLHTRKIVPSRFYLESYRYWIIEQNRKTKKYKLYNIDTKETLFVDQMRIFMAHPNVVAKTKHLSFFMFQKFNKDKLLKMKPK